MRSAAIILFSLTFNLSTNGQQIITDKLPEAFYALNTDTARMAFIAKAVTDSTDEGQLTHVYGWSKTGLALAEKNHNDTMQGIFLFYIAKAFTYHFNQYDSAIYYYKKVLPFFPDKMRKYNVFSVREIMERYSDLGNKDSSFVYLDSLKALIDTMPDRSPRKVSLSQNIATVYQWFGMFKTAIHYFQIAINGDRANGNSRGLGIALANLGLLYNEMEDDEKAIQYSKEALSYLSDVKRPFTQTAANVADFYLNKKNTDSAAKYLKISDSVLAVTRDPQSIVINDLIRARISLSKKNYEEAEALVNKHFENVASTDNRYDLCKLYLFRAELDSARQKYPQAMGHAKQALLISKDKEFITLVVIALQQLVVFAKKQGDYKSALEYQSEYLQIKDSLSNAKAKSTVADLEISYQTLQKEQQISLLKKENDVKNLQLKSSRQQFLFIILGIVMLLFIAAVVFYQRQQRNKIELQKIKAELENQVLRLQMNPHFIFNSLNSIENFIMKNEKRLASDYLNKFARLIRMILDSSRNEVVPIKKDMETLQLYIDLEQLRFNNRFNYKTVIDPVLSSGDYQVPSLLLQPYVENAIVHGLAHSEESDLHLTIMASLEDDKIKYTIQDNGVGRKLAASYNQLNKPYHRSVGLKITEERINLYNKQPEGNGFVHFTDLTDDDNRPRGTRVEITLNAR